MNMSWMFHLSPALAAAALVLAQAGNCVELVLLLHPCLTVICKVYAA